ncbi:unnamed protein product [Urochloa humidicola]
MVSQHIAPKGTSQIRLGLEAQRDAFRVVVDLNENTDTDCPEFKAALSTFVFGFLEALKFHRAKQLTCDTISSGLEITIEKSSDPTLSEGLQKWSRFCGIANQDFFQYTFHGVQPGSRNLYERNLAGITSLTGVLDNILIAPFGLSLKYFDCPPRKSSIWSPIDAGNGDEEVSLLGNFDYTTLSAWQHGNFMRERYIYVGNRAGGPPHRTAVDFVNSGGSWKSPLPVRNMGHRFPYVQARSLHWAASATSALRWLKK